jgi:hypothetical protein
LKGQLTQCIFDTNVDDTDEAAGEDKVEELAKTVLEYAKQFKLLESFPSDVGFI